MRFRIVAVVATLCAVLVAQGAPELVIKARRLHVGDGTTIEGASLVIAGGKVSAVLGKDVAPPSAAETIELADAVVTPGLVEAESRVGMLRGDADNEEGRETTPWVRALDGVDRAHPGFASLLRSGVTTVVVLPGDRNVIGGVSCALKTTPDAATPIVDELALHAVIGRGPTARNSAFRGGEPTMFTRRPTTRMGVIAELRRAFLEAAGRNQPGWQALYPEREGLALARAGRGELPVAFVAQEAAEILAAIRLCTEAGIPKYRIGGTIESLLAVEDLKAAKVPVLLGPLFNVGNAPEKGGAISDPRRLDQAGVVFALSRGTDDSGSTLLDLARAAHRGGLDAGRAVAAVTGFAARVCGLDGRLGTLAVGKDADFCVWSTDPMSPTSRLLVAGIGGRIVWRDSSASAKKE
jgi:imidazolonepropionase-like amidohydrolase